MTTQTTIKIVDYNDQKTITEVYKLRYKYMVNAWPNYPYLNHETSELRDPWDKSASHFAAFCDEKIVGIIRLHQRGTTPYIWDENYRWDELTTISGIKCSPEKIGLVTHGFIEKEFRKSGVYEQLNNILFKEAAVQNIPIVAGAILKTNQASFAFYLKLGCKMYHSNEFFHYVYFIIK